VTTVNLLPLALYPPGAYTIPATPLQDGVASVRFAVQRCTTASPTVWPNATDWVIFDFQMSRDGGATWQQYFSGGSPGGIALDKFGVEVPEMTVQWDLPPVTNRQVRGGVTVQSAIGVRTKVDVTVT
jgi:hypothetical protein